MHTSSSTPPQHRITPKQPLIFALGEAYWGNAVGLDDFVYLTMGTGIGAGAKVGGKLLHGRLHPEMGPLMLPRHGDEFEGNGPVHGPCWEGLCSGPAIVKRTGLPAEELPKDHPAWPLLTQTTAEAIAAIAYLRALEASRT